MNNLEFKLDKSSKVKLYCQLYQNIKEMIDKGDLVPNTKLPSIRTLSEDFAISRNTVTKAYDELERDGYIYSLSKSGFFVKKPGEVIPEEIPSFANPEDSEDAGIPTVESIIKERAGESEISIPQPEETPNTFILKDNFSTESIDSERVTRVNIQAPAGVEDKSSLIMMNSGDVVNSKVTEDEDEIIDSPLEAFIKSCINALEEHKFRLEKDREHDITGEAPLRIAIASFLYKFHNFDVNPASLIIGSNLAFLLLDILSLDQFQHPEKYLRGLLQLAEKSISTSSIIPRVGFEGPVDISIRKAFTCAGFEIVDLECDEHGVKPEDIEKAQLTVFFRKTSDIKETSEFLERQTSIVKWLNDALYRYIIVYDNSSEKSDYSTKYKSLDSKQVIYLNSFSNLISKSISTAFSAIPNTLIQSYKKKYSDFDCPVSMLEQCGLVDFLLKDKLIKYLTSIEQL